MIKYRSGYGFSKFKTLVRFENQSINWRKSDILIHSSAFAKALQSLNIKNRVLFWMDSNHTMEYFTALMACKMRNLEPISM